MIVLSFVGIVLGVAVMLLVRHLAFGILLVPMCVAIGPVLMASRRYRPSRTFLVVYVAVTGILFALMALTGPGFLERFDPP